jgi:crotonobetainyl-CoA:carnitine CoA-transferase CaiB-like acyl-CoA transferase
MTSLLGGMRVLDLSAYRPMPHATQILADLGAEVLKVEPPGGDPMRAYPEIFASVARGKRSVVLDLRTEDGRARALELAAVADVVCESWRPGVADRLGVGYDAVRAVNPAVVYCSLSGFGQSGALRDVPGHDLNFQAIAGAVAPRAGEEPQVPRLPVADLEGGTLCATLICAAWARKQATGDGERIDVAMADVVAWWVGPRSGTALEGSESRSAGSPGYGVFRTADGRWLALGVLGEARLWDGICRALELDGLAGLSFADRLARQAEVDGAIASAVARLDRDEAVARLEAEGAPVTPVLSPEEATAHPQLAGRGFHVESDAGLVAGLPVRFGAGEDATGAVLPTHVPAPDEHPTGFTPR